MPPAALQMGHRALAPRAATSGARDQSQLVSPCLGQAAGVQQGGHGPREQGRSVSPGIRQQLPAGWAGTALPSW